MLTYAAIPAEAPTPDGRRPDAYDIYTIGIIGLRVLMPSLVAGEQVPCSSV
jgi:hypothetical protein